MSDMLSQMGVPPGWYADPHGRAVQRYYNGSAWTPYVIDAAGCQQVDGPPGPMGGPAPAQAHAGEGSIVIQNVVQVPHLYPVVMPVGHGDKRPSTALALSCIFGPLGVLYVNVGVGIVLTVLWLALFWTLVVPFGIWVGGMIYAYNAAQQHNLRKIAMSVGPQPIYGGVQPPTMWQQPMPVPAPAAVHAYGAMPPPPPATTPPPPPARVVADTSAHDEHTGPFL